MTRDRRDDVRRLASSPGRPGYGDRMSATVLAFLAVAVTGCGHVVDESDGGGRVGTATGRQTAAVAPLEDAVPVGATQIVDDGGVRTRVTVEGLSPAQPSVYGFPVAGELQQITVTVEVVDGATSVNPLYFTARASDCTAYGAALEPSTVNSSRKLCLRATASRASSPST